MKGTRTKEVQQRRVASEKMQKRAKMPSGRRADDPKIREILYKDAQNNQDDGEMINHIGIIFFSPDT